MSQTVNLKCPVCQHTSQKEVITYINTQLHPHLVSQLMQNQLYSFECDNCGAKRHLETQMVYHNPIDQYLIMVVPQLHSSNANAKDKLNERLPEGKDFSDYDLRLVPNMASLIEKIQIFDQDLSDQVVEIVKLLTDGLFNKEKPDVKVVNRFFFLQNNVPKILYVTDGEQYTVDFNDSLVEFAEGKYKKAMNQDYKGEFIVVNQKWAVNLLDNKPGNAQSEKEETE